MQQRMSHELFDCALERRRRVLRQHRAQIRDGSPLIEKVEQGSSEWLRSYLAMSQKILKNQLTVAPVDDHEG
jgi:hypothetical protein